MNILLFIDNLGSGGAQRQLVNLGILFKERGHSVKFLVYGDVPFFEKKLIDNNIEIVKIIEKNYIKRLFKIRKFIRKNWQNVVISFLETPNFIACFSAIGKHPWKLITNERSGSEQSFKGFKNKVFKWFERFSDHTVCNSYAARNIWLKYLPKFENKLSVIYNYIDIGNFKGEYVPLKNGKTNVVVVASYQYIKNVINVVIALSNLSDTLKSRLIINWYGRIEVTDNNTRAYDEACSLIEKHNLNDIIRLHEENSQIYPIMYSADFVGLFSRYEGLPNVICEALSLGKPIIMTPVSDYNILLQNNGILCQSFETADILQSFEKVCFCDKNIVFQMGEKSSEIANELFDKDHVYEKWEKLFI